MTTIKLALAAGLPIHQAIAGQMVGKIAVTALVVALVTAVRVRRVVIA